MESLRAVHKSFENLFEELNTLEERIKLQLEEDPVQREAALFLEALEEHVVKQDLLGQVKGLHSQRVSVRVEIADLLKENIHLVAALQKHLEEAPEPVNSKSFASAAHSTSHAPSDSTSVEHEQNLQDNNDEFQEFVSHFETVPMDVRSRCTSEEAYSALSPLLEHFRSNPGSKGLTKKELSALGVRLVGRKGVCIMDTLSYLGFIVRARGTISLSDQLLY